MRTLRILRHPLHRRGLALAVLLGLALMAWASPAAAQHRVMLDAESRLWIEGSSSVNTFVCRAAIVEGEGALTAQAGRATAAIRVPAARFDCGKARMNDDFYAALKADAHPVIHFELGHAEVVSATPGAGPHDVRVTGRLTIAGVTRTVALTAEGWRCTGGLFRVVGAVPLRMTDFGITPPTALLGLIKAHDGIVVRFDLAAAPIPAPAPSLH